MRDNTDWVADANSFDGQVNVGLPSPDEAKHSLGVQYVIFFN